MIKHSVLVGLIALGGALGAILRYFISLFISGYWGNSFPFGTLTVNVIGSFIMGLFLGWFEIQGVHEQLKAFALIGVLGALTTFSTFSSDTLLLLQTQQLGKALLNVGLNTVLCISMVYLGQQFIFRI